MQASTRVTDARSSAHCHSLPSATPALSRRTPQKICIVSSLAAVLFARARYRAPPICTSWALPPGRWPRRACGSVSDQPVPAGPVRAWRSGDRGVVVVRAAPDQGGRPSNPVVSSLPGRRTRRAPGRPVLARRAGLAVHAARGARRRAAAGPHRAADPARPRHGRRRGGDQRLQRPADLHLNRHRSAGHARSAHSPR
jgi:hypothetical protein